MSEVLSALSEMGIQLSITQMRELLDRLDQALDRIGQQDKNGNGKPPSGA